LREREGKYMSKDDNDDMAWFQLSESLPYYEGDTEDASDAAVINSIIYEWDKYHGLGSKKAVL
jgi:hypothetical protein